MRSDSPAKTEYAGLFFRSQAEVNLFRAFQAAAVMVAPLPVFVRGSGPGSRLEPDFVVIVPPKIMVVEVDGAMHHESPVEADERLAEFRRSGVLVERVRASDCHPLEAAKRTSERLLKILNQAR